MENGDNSIPPQLNRSLSASPAVGDSVAKDFLDSVQLRLVQTAVAGLAAVAVGLYLLLFTAAHHASGHADLRDVVIGVTLIVGPLWIGGVAWWLASVLPSARRGLIEPPVEVLLCASISRSKSSLNSASLWRNEGGSVQLIAEFARSIWSRPFRLRTQMTRAWAYGIPAKGEVVTVVSEHGALVGRIRRSSATSAAELAPVLPPARVA